MPVLKQLTCSIELGVENIKLDEYGTNYGDGYVQTFVAVPNADINFSIHLTSERYIAPGIAMFVFIDGQYQANRARRGLVMPEPGVAPEKSQIDLRVRQKETKQAGGTVIGQAWSFRKLDTAKAPKPEATIAENVGSIEVVVLRCKEIPKTRLAVPGSSRPGDAAKEQEPLEKERRRRKHTNPVTPPVSAAVGGTMALFDGPADELDGGSDSGNFSRRASYPNVAAQATPTAFGVHGRRHASQSHPFVPHDPHQGGNPYPEHDYFGGHPSFMPGRELQYPQFNGPYLVPQYVRAEQPFVGTENVHLGYPTLLLLNQASRPENAKMPPHDHRDPAYFDDQRIHQWRARSPFSDKATCGTVKDRDSQHDSPGSTKTREKVSSPRTKRPADSSNRGNIEAARAAGTREWLDNQPRIQSAGKLDTRSQRYRRMPGAWTDEGPRSSNKIARDGEPVWDDDPKPDKEGDTTENNKPAWDRPASYKTAPEDWDNPPKKSNSSANSSRKSAVSLDWNNDRRETPRSAIDGSGEDNWGWPAAPNWGEPIPEEEEDDGGGGWPAAPNRNIPNPKVSGGDWPTVKTPPNSRQEDSTSATKPNKNDDDDRRPKNPIIGSPLPPPPVRKLIPKPYWKTWNTQHHHHHPSPSSTPSDPHNSTTSSPTAKPKPKPGPGPGSSNRHPISTGPPSPYTHLRARQRSREYLDDMETPYAVFRFECRSR